MFVPRSLLHVQSRMGKLTAWESTMPLVSWPPDILVLLRRISIAYNHLSLT